MGGFTNGRFPLSMFIHRGGNIYLTPSLNARWNEAVRLALAKYGVRLYITGDIDGLGGWNGYRPYDAQVAYKQHYGIWAAWPGTSSHGGIYQGRLVFAVDVANWQRLGRTDAQAWGRFVAIMRLVGLTTNFVSPTELWHVGDMHDPWVAPVFGNTAGTIKPIPVTREEEDDNMKVFGYKNPGDKNRVYYVTMDFAGGLWDEFVTSDGEYARSVAMKWGGGAPLLSLAHRDQLAEKFAQRWPDLASMAKR